MRTSFRPQSRVQSCPHPLHSSMAGAWTVVHHCCCPSSIRDPLAIKTPQAPPWHSLNTPLSFTLLLCAWLSLSHKNPQILHCRPRASFTVLGVPVVQLQIFLLPLEPLIILSINPNLIVLLPSQGKSNLGFVQIQPKSFPFFLKSGECSISQLLAHGPSMGCVEAILMTRSCYCCSGRRLLFFFLGAGSGLRRQSSSDHLQSSSVLR